MTVWPVLARPGQGKGQFADAGYTFPVQTTTFLLVMSPGSAQSEGKGKGEMEPTGKTSEEVEVPKLAENGQNWKIYHMKVIKAAAMDIHQENGEEKIIHYNCWWKFFVDC